MTTFDFDACVVGAGAVGLACGYVLAERGLSVVVLDKDRAIGQGVSSRNSEVIHGGLYYPTGSLKARLCVEGRRKLYAFLDKHHVAYRKCGKLVVATDLSEIPRVEAVAAQARENGVEGIRELSGAEAMALEPGLRAHAAILSPESGVFDSHGYMLALRGEIEAQGGAVALSTPFEKASAIATGGFVIQTGGETPTELAARVLVTAPGLGAQSTAGRIESFPAELIPKLWYGKGVYCRLSGKAPFERLIYPPPIPGALGTHYRKDLGGQAVFGPDLRFVASEDYSVDSAAAESFYPYVRRFWPELPDGALQVDYAGIRPKLHGPGEPQPDFRIEDASSHGLAGLVALFGIESPGLTSSLAIGREVADRLLEAG
jgi:L-2-hydroxyglutarate oxidase LhgO